MPKFNPPEGINFQKPNWLEWKARFQRYRTATKLAHERGEIQVSTLVYTMGIEAEKIFKSFVFEEEAQKNDYELMLQKYDDEKLFGNDQSFIKEHNKRGKLYKNSSEPFTTYQSTVISRTETR